MKTKKDELKQCGNCIYKYSCGYSSLLRDKETDKCCEPHLFKKKIKRVWSFDNQKLEPENTVREEYRNRKNPES